jgi:hypothetical protein
VVAVTGGPPRWRTAPPYRLSLGPDVAALGAEIGRRPDRYEQAVLDDLFARHDDGTAAVTSAAVIAPTVQVKHSIVLQAVLAWLFLEEEPRVLWSVDDSRSTSDMLASVEEVLAHPLLTRRVKRISRMHGGEEVELRSGPRLLFRERRRGGGGGMNVTRLILDDAHVLEAAHLTGLLPTLAAAAYPQVLYAAVAGLPEGEVLRDIRARGQAVWPEMAYAEWLALPSCSC